MEMAPKRANVSSDLVKRMWNKSRYLEKKKLLLILSQRFLKVYVYLLTHSMKSTVKNRYQPISALEWKDCNGILLVISDTQSHNSNKVGSSIQARSTAPAPKMQTHVWLVVHCNASLESGLIRWRRDHWISLSFL